MAKDFYRGIMKPVVDVVNGERLRSSISEQGHMNRARITEFLNGEDNHGVRILVNIAKDIEEEQFMEMMLQWAMEIAVVARHHAREFNEFYARRKG